MKIKIIFLFILFLLFSCFSERIEDSLNNSGDDEFVQFEVIQSQYNDTRNSIRLAIKFPTRKLIFKKMSDHFYSDITIDLLILNEDNKILMSDSWDEMIIKKYYDDTKSFSETKLFHDIILPIGKYNLNVIINDFENHINWIANSEFDVNKELGLTNVDIYYKRNEIYRALKILKYRTIFLI